MNKLYDTTFYGVNYDFNLVFFISRLKQCLSKITIVSLPKSQDSTFLLQLGLKLKSCKEGTLFGMEFQLKSYKGHHFSVVDVYQGQCDSFHYCLLSFFLLGWGILEMHVFIKLFIVLRVNVKIKLFSFISYIFVFV